MQMFESNTKIDKNVLLFVNDSYFSFLLANKLIEKYHNNIALVVFSKSITGSSDKIFKIFNKSSKRYFFYRSFIYFLTKTIFIKKSVNYLVNKYDIESVEVNSLDKLVINENIEVGFAFNFDMILKNKIISKFKKGIYNVHASRLPFDKGISPVLWAFARGDREIWSTIYKIDEGIDSGDILAQFPIEVKEKESAFSIYSRVCEISGEKLEECFLNIVAENVELKKQPISENTSYYSWPDAKFDMMLKNSKRELFNIFDFLKIFNNT